MNEEHSEASLAAPRDQNLGVVPLQLHRRCNAFENLPVTVDKKDLHGSPSPGPLGHFSHGHAPVCEEWWLRLAGSRDLLQALGWRNGLCAAWGRQRDSR